MKIFRKIYSILCKAEEVIAMSCLLGATIILCGGALARALGYPLASITEISLCLFAWCIFLGANVAYRKSSLVYVEIIIDRLFPALRRIFYAAIFLIVGGFLCIFIFQSIRLNIHSWIRRWASIPSLSYGWIALSMPVGSVLMLITTCIHFYNLVIKGEEPVKDVNAYLDPSCSESVEINLPYKG